MRQRGLRIVCQPTRAGIRSTGRTEVSDVVSIRDEALQLELPFKRQCVDVQRRLGSPSSPSGLHVAVKRLLDIVAATLLILATVPVLGLAALAIAAEGGGPIIFSQVRIGKDGRRFTLYKLRTMIPDAEWRLGDLLAHNQRTGPLFKMEDDPRVTRVGRILRAMSIDELPQLINVLRGEMSMVGPRPALPAEVDAFSDRLRQRLLVLPGITGLWQIQSRHSPSFALYERLDLLYLEKSSLGLDLLIMVKTAGQILTAVFAVAARALPLVMACAHQRRPCDIAQVDLDFVATQPVPSSALKG